MTFSGILGVAFRVFDRDLHAVAAAGSCASVALVVSAGELLPMLEACSSGQCMGCIISPPDLTVRTVYAGSGEGAGSAPQVVQASEAGAAIADTGRLFLRNLSYAATETDLTELLQPYGDVTEVHLVLDKCALLNPLGALLVKTRPSDDVEALKHKCIADYLARIVNSSCLRPCIR